MESQLWINEKSALEVLQKSRWASSRRMSSEPRQNYADILSFGIDLAKRNRERMFLDWCGLALKKFRNTYPLSSREKNDTTEYDEAELRRWLDPQYNDDVTAEFGSP